MSRCSGPGSSPPRQPQQHLGNGSLEPYSLLSDSWPASVEVQSVVGGAAHGFDDDAGTYPGGHHGSAHGDPTSLRFSMDTSVVDSSACSVANLAGAGARGMERQSNIGLAEEVAQLRASVGALSSKLNQRDQQLNQFALQQQRQQQQPLTLHQQQRHQLQHQVVQHQQQRALEMPAPQAAERLKPVAQALKVLADALSTSQHNGIRSTGQHALAAPASEDAYNEVDLGGPLHQCATRLEAAAASSHGGAPASFAREANCQAATSLSGTPQRSSPAEGALQARANEHASASSRAPREAKSPCVDDARFDALELRFENMVRRLENRMADAAHVPTHHLPQGRWRPRRGKRTDGSYHRQYDYDDESGSVSGSTCEEHHAPRHRAPARAKPRAPAVASAEYPRPEYIAACGVLRARLGPLLDPSKIEQKALGFGELKANLGEHCAVKCIQAAARTFLSQFFLGHLARRQQRAVAAQPRVGASPPPSRPSSGVQSRPSTGLLGSRPGSALQLSRPGSALSRPSSALPSRPGSAAMQQAASKRPPGVPRLQIERVSFGEPVEPQDAKNETMKPEDLQREEMMMLEEEVMWNEQEYEMYYNYQMQQQMYYQQMQDYQNMLQFQQGPQMRHMHRGPGGPMWTHTHTSSSPMFFEPAMYPDLPYAEDAAWMQQTLAGMPRKGQHRGSSSAPNLGVSQGAAAAHVRQQQKRLQADKQPQPRQRQPQQRQPQQRQPQQRQSQQKQQRQRPPMDLSTTATTTTSSKNPLSPLSSGAPARTLTRSASAGHRRPASAISPYAAPSPQKPRAPLTVQTPPASAAERLLQAQRAHCAKGWPPMSEAAFGGPSRPRSRSAQRSEPALAKEEE
eukprot:TRINITY_DN15858_c0_g1_i2.p1 TRINITY_DN15858_c0_g1~~TRINITY_DN15858_c0_g1_i2.p1  ORF type:complete len:855 (+),score=186.33 TRINITY_DN15858_c0_g1_i2:61-2625(+)